MCCCFCFASVVEGLIKKGGELDIKNPSSKSGFVFVSAVSGGFQISTKTVCLKFRNRFRSHGVRQPKLTFFCQVELFVRHSYRPVGIRLLTKASKEKMQI